MDKVKIFEAAQKISKNIKKTGAAIERCAADAAQYFTKADTNERLEFAQEFYDVAAPALRVSFRKKASLAVNGVENERIDSRGRVLRIVKPAFSVDKEGVTLSCSENNAAETEIVDSALIRFSTSEKTDVEKIDLHIKALIALKCNETTLVKKFRELQKPLPATRKGKKNGKK